jgi:DNA polymerase-3 subunit delta'
MTDSRHTSELFGHETAERAFLDAWNTGRLAHAWLITGQKGIGKSALAWRIARFALAQAGQGVAEQGGGLFGPSEPAKPEGLHIPPTHPIFQRVASGGHADLKSIERGLNDQGKLRTEIVVEDVRSVGGFLSLTPAEGGWRIVIVDAAEEMNRNAANAILKELEEPPSRALLLLVSHAPGRLLPTIRSRCRRLALKPLSEETVVKLLATHRPDLPPDEAVRLARLSEGSIGRALDLAEEGGLELYQEMIRLLSSLPRLDVPALHAFGDRMAKADGAEAFRTLSTLFSGWLVRLIRLASTGHGDEVVQGEKALMTKLAQAGGLDRWVELWEKSVALFARAEAVHLDRKQVLLNAFLAIERLMAQRA